MLSEGRAPWGFLVAILGRDFLVNLNVQVKSSDCKASSSRTDSAYRDGGASQLASEWGLE